MTSEATDTPDRGVTLPSPTVWPLVTALGLTLVAAGLVTNLVWTAAGVAMTIVGLVGWVGQLVSPAGEEQVPLVPPERRPRPIEPVTVDVARRRALRPRTPLPERVHPYSAGAIGGAIGGVAMAATAIVYGLVSGHGIWYPVNLLSGMVLPSMGSATLQQIEQFNLVALVLGLPLHVCMSIGIGLIFAVLSPTLPGWSIVWAGIVAPWLWSGGVFLFVDVISPAMEHYIDWPWFIASQFFYGLVMGVVVVLREKVYVEQARNESPIEGR